MARSAKITRQTQLAKREGVRKQLLRVFDRVEKGFTDQINRADEALDYWDIYNCILSSRQFYSGNSKLFVPLVHNALEARKTRFLNQLFPQSGRNVDVTSEDGEIPHATMALLEMYVDRAKLKTTVMPALLVTGDIEGQMTVCVSWESRTRHVVSRETSPLKIGGIEHPELGDVEELKAETVTDAGPSVDIISDGDLLILPVMSADADDALAAGGSITTLCRWTEARIEELIEAGEIDTDLSAELLVEMRGREQRGSVAKKLADAAGISADGKHALIYRTWTRIELQGERRLVLAYYAGDQQILGCKLCPYWNDKSDIITRPVKQMPGVVKGMSLVKPCADMQYAANDALNEGMDSATYSMLPVIMTDPEKNPRVGSMVMDLMAVWETSPRDTQPLQMPQLYQHAFNIVQSAERYIMATLGVNASMLPQSTGVPGRKRNQAEIAMEQQVDLLSTSIEIGAAESLLTEVIGRFADYDAQFRDEELTIRTVGELGIEAAMEKVPPIQMGKRWQFRWFGVEQARTAQQIQQQIALLNVIRAMSQDPSVREAGYRLNAVPFIRTVTENAFGPRLAPEIFVNEHDRLTIPPEFENQMLEGTLLVVVSPMDDDPKHLQAHMPLMQHEDVAVRAAAAGHIAEHQQQMQKKQMMQMQQQMMQKMQQMGGGPPGAGGGPKGPAPGGQPAMPRQGRQPPGALHPDQMARAGGVVQMPRRPG